MIFARANPNASHSLKSDTRYIIHSQTDFDDVARDVAIVSEINKSYRFLVPLHHLIPETTKPEPRRVSPEHTQRQRDLRRDLVVQITGAVVQHFGLVDISDAGVENILSLATKISERF